MQRHSIASQQCTCILMLYSTLGGDVVTVSLFANYVTSLLVIQHAIEMTASNNRKITRKGDN